MMAERKHSGVAVLGAVLLGALVLGGCLFYAALWLGTLAHH